MKAEEQQGMPNEVIATATGHRILLRLRKSQQDITFIKSLPNSRWDKSAFCWVVIQNQQHIGKICQYFGNRLQWIEKPGNGSGINKERYPAEKETLYIVKYHNGRVRLYFQFNPDLIAHIKQQPFYAWDSETLTWTIPHTEKILEKMVNFCKSKGWKYKYLEDIRQLQRVSRPGPESIKNYRQCPEVYIEKLTIMRYSRNTIRVYTECFKEFINYFSEKEINEITQSEIMDYQRYLVEKRCVSNSYQNQAINSIKFYYERVLGGNREKYYIERPRKEKILPEVLSEQEALLLFNALDNLKHKCMIMTAYSGGDVQLFFCKIIKPRLTV